MSTTNRPAGPLLQATAALRFRVKGSPSTEKPHMWIPGGGAEVKSAAGVVRHAPQRA